MSEWDTSQRELDDLNDFLESGGIPSAAFENIGDSWRGQVIRAAKVQSRDFETGELQTWDDGSPKYQLNIDIQTDVRDPEINGDDGVRRLYVRGNLLQATRQALRAKSAKLLPGGFIEATYTADGTASKRGFQPPKMYTATWEPGTLPQGLSADDLTD